MNPYIAILMVTKSYLKVRFALTWQCNILDQDTKCTIDLVTDRHSICHAWLLFRCSFFKLSFFSFSCFFSAFCFSCASFLSWAFSSFFCSAACFFFSAASFFFDSSSIFLLFWSQPSLDFDFRLRTCSARAQRYAVKPGNQTKNMFATRVTTSCLTLILIYKITYAKAELDCFAENERSFCLRDKPTNDQSWISCLLGTLRFLGRRWPWRWRRTARWRWRHGRNTWRRGHISTLLLWNLLSFLYCLLLLLRVFPGLAILQTLLTSTFVVTIMLIIAICRLEKLMADSVTCVLFSFLVPNQVLLCVLQHM